MNPELQARGVAIVRGLLSGAEAESLKGLLERAYAAADNGTAHADAQERVRAWGGVNVHLIEQFGIDEQELIDGGTFTAAQMQAVQTRLSAVKQSFAAGAARTGPSASASTSKDSPKTK